jgi:type I restriction enzyme S subunit
VSKTLNDICELIVDSEHKTAPTQEVGFPMVRTPNIGSGRLIWDKMRFVSQDNFLKWTRRAVPRVDDLILAREAPVGNVIRVPEDSKFCLGQRTVLLRPNRSVVDAKYLMYYLLSPNVRERLLAVSYGATVDHLNMADIRSLDVSDMPSLEQQKIISSRLSVFDDLIEVNGRRIKVLEEMARRIYREWFIDFKYPDHEKVKMVDSGHPDFGMIPEGWFVKRLSDLMDIKGGSQPAKSEWSKESKAGHVRMVQIRDYESDKYIEYVKDTPKLRKCEEHDVMIARYGASVGRICDGLNGAYNVALVKVLPKRAEVLEF